MRLGSDNDRPWKHRLAVTVFLAVALTLTATPVDAGSSGSVDVEYKSCMKPMEDQKEIYGPTDVNAQLGNQGLSVAENKAGTVTVFKWPNPSYYDQIKYHATNRSKPYMGADENAGSFLGLTVQEGTSAVGETGTLELGADDGEWRHVELENSYEDPVVVTSPLSRNGPQAAHPRVRSVKQDSFQIQVEEWGYLDGDHVAEEVSYLVVESGSHELPDGTRIDVGTVETDESWKQVEIQGGFDQPAVLTGAQTHRSGNVDGSGSDSVVTRTKNVDEDGFAVRVQEMESKGNHVEEQVGYVTVESGAGSNSGGSYEAGVTDDTVTDADHLIRFSNGYEGTPVFLAGIQGFDGGDTSNLRYTELNDENVTVNVEEERSADGEVRHISENLGYVAFGSGVIEAKDTETTFLRDWSNSQRYLSNYSDTVETTYRSDRYGLEVTVTDVLPKDRDVLTRNVEVERLQGSSVDNVEVAAFENFNLVASKHPMVPTKDWCNEGSNNDAARYDDELDAVLHYKQNSTTDSEVVAGMAFSGESSGHQVGGDTHEGGDAIEVTVPILGHARVSWGSGDESDAYRDIQDGVLSGNDRFSGQTTAALTRQLNLADGENEATLHLAAGESKEEVEKTLEESRGTEPEDEMEDKKAWFRELVGDAPLPGSGDEDVEALSRRALVTLVQNYHPESGSIVASIATQSPYGADWVRDGAYFNYVLDRLLGKHDWVRKHNLWYASLQEGAPGSDHVNSALIPNGSWAMNYYADGEVAGPIPWEIDETGYGAWTLYDHYRVTGNETYLRQVYPAIKRAADHLVECKSDNGLQCSASEDDHIQPSQSIVGGASVHLGLESAAKAAEALGRNGDAERYRSRMNELGKAMDGNYWSPAKGYDGNPRAVFPAALKPLDSPSMQPHYEEMWSKVRSTLKGEKDVGLYESKHLYGLAKAWENSPNISRVKRGLDWVAQKHATPDTNVMGEVWLRDGGEIETSVSQPHAWEQILFYLAALETYNKDPEVQEKLDRNEDRWSKNDGEVTVKDLPSGTVSPATSFTTTVEVENTGEAKKTYYLGYGVRDEDGNYHYGASGGGKLTLAPGETQLRNLSFSLGSNAKPGSYDVTVTLWNEKNVEHLHTRLDSRTIEDAFTLGETVGEFGSVSVSASDDHPGGSGNVGATQTVEIQGDYENPVVLASITSKNGGHPAHVRVTEVNDNNFEIQVEEWDYMANDGGHVTETVDYLVVESGTHNLADGRVVTAGKTSADDGWRSVDLNAFDFTPVVLAEPQTETGEGWWDDQYDSAVSRLDNVGNDGFEVRVQEQEGGDNRQGGHPDETVGYAVFSGYGNGVDVGTTGDSVTQESVSLDADGSSDVAVVDMQSFDGGDSAGVRGTGGDASRRDVYVEEEGSADSETRHTTENVGWVAGEEGSHLVAVP
ncbi:MAG: hypothetical protein ABEK59_02950 [Halobacteria archaeon]